MQSQVGCGGVASEDSVFGIGWRRGMSVQNFLSDMLKDARLAVNLALHRKYRCVICGNTYSHYMVRHHWLKVYGEAFNVCDKCWSEPYFRSFWGLDD